MINLVEPVVKIIRRIIRVCLFSIFSIRFQNKKIRIEHLEYDTRATIVSTNIIYEIPIDNLCVNILGLGYVNVKESPHYEFIHALENSNVSTLNTSYVDYISRYYPKEDITEACNSFRRTNEYVKKNLESILILVDVGRTFSNPFKVIDGTHRLASLQLAGVKTVKCASRL